MRIVGLVGAGDLGAVLAKRLVATGHTVQVANSRGKATLAQFAPDTGAQPEDLSDVATGTDLLIVAIPLGGYRDLAKKLNVPPGIPVVDASNYVPPRDGNIPAIDAGQPESAWVSEMLGVPVVKAFNNITDHSVMHRGRPAGSEARIALPVAGDDPALRGEVGQLVEVLGFDAYDAGPLANSWRQQIGQPVYCTDPTLEQLPRLLARADRSTVERNRADAMRVMEKMPADFPKPDLTRAARFMAGIDRFSPATWQSMASLAWAMMRRKR